MPIIKKYGKNKSRIVYRGQNSQSNTITKLNPFFSTSPTKKMAESFVEINWETNTRIGHLFKIHLIKQKMLSTQTINFTISSEVKHYLLQMLADAKIEKGNKTYTIKEYMPKLKHALHDLVHTSPEEILVLNDGVFYKNKELTTPGYNPNSKGELETWFSNK